MSTGNPADFEQIPLECSNGYKLVNPQAGLAFDLEGPDSHRTYMPLAPAFQNDEMNAELIELTDPDLVPSHRMGNSPNRLNAPTLISGARTLLP